MRRVALVLGGGLAGCAGAGGDLWSRHLDGEAWRASLAAQVDRPWQAAPAAGLLLATPLLYVVDDRTQAEATEHTLNDNNVTRSGDYAVMGLSGLAVGLGVTEWGLGDGGRSMFALAESAVVSQAATELLKYSIRRRRPDYSSRDSFPSGHTSFAFTMATYVARVTDDWTDAWYGKLGYLAYVPAIYAGYNRTEGNRHYSTDVVFGAFLGVFATNVIYDLHCGAGQEAARGRGARFSLESGASEFGPSLDLVVRF